jgi:cation:H+ antiporter
MALAVSSELIALVVFLGGVALVIASVEVFVESVAESALALGVSSFFLTVVLAGTDVENAILGLAAVFGSLPDLALGTVFGEALFVLGAAVGLAGVLVPFETEVPRSYLLLTVVSPVLFFVLALDGTLTRFDGVILTVAFLPAIGVVYALERNQETRYLSAEEIEEPTNEESGATDENGSLRERYAKWYRVGLVLVGIIGMTIGSELAVRGARELLSALGITGLAFGATVVSFIASLEELFLTVEPVRQGRPQIGVGNVVGSVLFFVTANVGVLALVRPIDTSGTVLTVHWPFFAVLLVVVAGVFWRGRVYRADGVVLLGLYGVYWGANYLL